MTYRDRISWQGLALVVLAVAAVILVLLIDGLSVGAQTGSSDHRAYGLVEEPELQSLAVLVDDFAPQPRPGELTWNHNRLGGDRGAIDGPGGGTVEWGQGMVTATITGGTDSWQGVWTSLNHPILDCTPLDFSAILPVAIDPDWQGHVDALRFEILDGQGAFEVELQIGESTACPPQERVWPTVPTTSTLYGGPQTLIYTLPSDLGPVQSLNWKVVGAEDDFVVVDRVVLTATMSHVPDTSVRAFLWSYATLLNNWDPDSSLTRDHAYYAAGQFDNVSASGMQAASAVMAWKLGLISEASATEIVTGITEALLALDRDPCGGNLWPHYLRDGAMVPGTEWSSIDTIIAAVALIDARQALNLDTGPVEAVLTEIGWDELLLPDRSISHGYLEDCSQIGGGWHDFGGESWLVNLAYAAATGNFAESDHRPPTFNGSGFIDELPWLLVPPPCRDEWNLTWNEYCSEAARVQIAYYATEYEPPHPCYGGQPRLFGLSAAEVPDLSAVPANQAYQAFGVGGEAEANDGTDLLGHAVITPHYLGLASSHLPAQASATWEWLEEQGLSTPLNTVESLMFTDEPTCNQVVWNAMKGSWNLSLQTLGWGRLLTGEGNPLHDAAWRNDFLRTGYELMGQRYCPAYLPLVLRGYSR